MTEAHFCQRLTHLLCKEAEIVYHIFVVSTEVLTQLRILSSHTHRTSIGMTLTHHYTTQHNEHGSTKTKLLGTQQCHRDDVASRFYLSIGLQTHLSTQSVKHQCLLSFRQTNLRRNTCIAHWRGRRSTCTTFSTRNYNQVGFSLSHTCSNGSYPTLGNQLHTDLCFRIYILQVEDKLSQVLDRVNIVMRRRRNKRDSRNRMTCLRNNLVHLITRQLTTLTRLCTLCNLNLNFFGIHQIFSGHTKTTWSNLLGLATERDTVIGFAKAFIVFATFTRITTCTQFIHSKRQSLVCLFADCTKRHGTCYKMLHNVVNRFNLIYRYWVTLKFKEIAQEDRLLFLVYQGCKFFELFVTTQTSSQLQSRNRFGVPSMLFAIFTIAKLTYIGKQALQFTIFIIGRITFIMELAIITGYLVEMNTTNATCSRTKISAQQLIAQTDSLENLSTTIRAQCANAHFWKHLIESFANSLYIILFSRFIIHLHLTAFYQIVEHSECHIRINSTGTIANEQGSMHHFACFATLNHQGCFHALLHRNKVMVYCTHCQ